MSENQKLYRTLIEGYAKAYPFEKKPEVQKKVAKIWNDLKKNSKNLNFDVSQQLGAWKQLELKRIGKLSTFWSKVMILIVYECLKIFFYREKSEGFTWILTYFNLLLILLGFYL